MMANKHDCLYNIRKEKNKKKYGKFNVKKNNENFVYYLKILNDN
jgi:hypothetical protein